jgi:broad specificity phosphatase PhoE|tara:strand:+ start:267 stop:947 length:681 start_codon:yes stop_codon:yes gene_type:complete
MADQIDINELRNIFSTSNKKRKEIDFARKIAKEKEKQQIKEATAKPLTKQERMEAEVKRLKTQDELNKLTGRGKAESGADAVDRLLKAMKDQRNLMYDKEGNPVFKGKTEISPKGIYGSNFRIAQERMDELQEDLQTAQKAKKESLTFQEAKRNKKLDDKYREYLKMFELLPKTKQEINESRIKVNEARVQRGLKPLEFVEENSPGVDSRKAKYMAELQTKSFFSK